MLKVDKIAHLHFRLNYLNHLFFCKCDILFILVVGSNLSPLRVFISLFSYIVLRINAFNNNNNNNNNELNS